MTKRIGLVFAGGTGSRMGSDGIPKQFLLLKGKPIIIHTLEYFEKSTLIDEIYVCSVEEGIEYLRSQVLHFGITKVKDIIPGGTSGQDSIYRLLKKSEENNDGESIVLIHDGVRPFITQEVIAKNIEAVEKYGSAITCTGCYETIITSSDGVNVNTVPFRKETFAAQAPQSFRLKDILSAHEVMRKQNPDYINIVDSCTLFKTLDIDVHMVEGNKGNIKVTYPEDFYLIEALFEFRDNPEGIGMGENDGYFATIAKGEK